MPKRIEPEAKRVHFHCMLSPATLRAINELVASDGGSQGEVVDRAIALLAFGEEVAVVKARKSKGIIDDTFIEEAKRTVNHPPQFVEPAPVYPPYMREGARIVNVPRGIRPKGDAKR